MTNIEELPNAAEATVSDFVDLADLASLITSLHGPDRAVDLVVDAMLGGVKVLERLTKEDIRNLRWLAEESPTYTSGGAPLRVLLQRRGYRAELAPAGVGYQAVLTSAATGQSKSASGQSEASAILLALLLAVSTKDS